MGLLKKIYVGATAAAVGLGVNAAAADGYSQDNPYERPFVVPNSDMPMANNCTYNARPDILGFGIRREFDECCKEGKYELVNDPYGATYKYINSPATCSSGIDGGGGDGGKGGNMGHSDAREYLDSPSEVIQTAEGRLFTTAPAKLSLG